MYKRQVHGREHRSLIVAGGLDGVLGAHLLPVDDLLDGVHKVVVIPVSYTHLDVYKRQLQASAEVELSAERVEQGGTVGVRISGMTGDAVPTIETDLGSVQCLSLIHI